MKVTTNPIHDALLESVLVINNKNSNPFLSCDTFNQTLSIWAMRNKHPMKSLNELMKCTFVWDISNAYFIR